MPFRVQRRRRAQRQDGGHGHTVAAPGHGPLRSRVGREAAGRLLPRARHRSHTRPVSAREYNRTALAKALQRTQGGVHKPPDNTLRPALAHTQPDVHAEGPPHNSRVP